MAAQDPAFGQELPDPSFQLPALLANACRKSPLWLQQQELQQIYNNYAVPRLHDQKKKEEKYKQNKNKTAKSWKKLLPAFSAWPKVMNQFFIERAFCSP